MNVKRFTGRTSRDALNLVRQAFGDDAVVLSTQPCAEGIEVLAMAGQAGAGEERLARPVRALDGSGPNLGRRAADRVEPVFDAGPATVIDDVARLEMSTLSFQDYVRQRMQKKRDQDAVAEGAAARAAAQAARPAAPGAQALRERSLSGAALPGGGRAVAPPHREVPVLRDEIQLPGDHPAFDEPASSRRDERVPTRREESAMLGELRAMRGLIEDRFGALAFMDKLQRQPRHALLTQKLLDCGFSPMLARRLVDGLPVDSPDDLAWVAGVLERNLATSEHDTALEDASGVFALIGATGVGKTTSTAKIAAAFATRHGAAHLGLITLDAYRMGAHEQLRSYGRILGVPVHTAHDRASLDDLLDLLSAKRLVLIDTAGMAQRDNRTRELLDMLSHASVRRVLVLSAAAQAETTEDVLQAYRAAQCAGVVLSKLDEAVKLAPVLDALLRHKLKVLAVANGQRVPEDWHRLSANALVHRALRGAASAAWKLDGGDLNLVLAGLPHAARAPAALVNAAHF